MLSSYEGRVSFYKLSHLAGAWRRLDYILSPSSASNPQYLKTENAKILGILRLFTMYLGEKPNIVEPLTAKY